MVNDDEECDGGDGDDDIQDVEGEVCNTMTSSAVHKDGCDDDDDWKDHVSWTPTSGRTCNGVRLWTSTSSLSERDAAKRIRGHFAQGSYVLLWRILP